MKFYITINYKGEACAITVRPEACHDKKMYQLEQWDLGVYKDESGWKCGTDHQMEDSLLQAVGKAIDNYNATHAENGELRKVEEAKN